MCLVLAWSGLAWLGLSLCMTMREIGPGKPLHIRRRHGARAVPAILQMNENKCFFLYSTEVLWLLMCAVKADWYTRFCAGNHEGLQDQAWRSPGGSWEMRMTKLRPGEWVGCVRREGKSWGRELVVRGRRKGRWKGWRSQRAQLVLWATSSECFLAGAGRSTSDLAQGRHPEERGGPNPAVFLRALSLYTNCYTSLRISLPGVSYREKRLEGKLQVILTCIHFLSSILKVRVKLTRSLVKD